MSINVKTLIAALCSCLGWIPSLAQANKADQCNAIFSAPMANLRTQVSESSMQRFINSQLCNQKYDTASNDSRAQLEIAYKVFSLGAQTGAQSVREYQEKFCSANVDTSSQAAFDYLQIQTVSNDALTAWSRCVELTNRGWDFEFQSPSAMTINFHVSRTQQGVVSLTGIEIHSENRAQVTCTGDKIGSIREGRISNIPIDQNGWSMSCHRKSQTRILNSQSYQYYPETTITVRAEGSVFAYSQPAVFRPQAPDEVVNQLRASLAKSTTDAASLKETVNFLSKRFTEVEKRLAVSEKNISTLTIEVTRK